MKRAKSLTLLAFIQCAQLTHAMETKDLQEKKAHDQVVALLLAIHNHNTALASLYIEQDTTFSTDPRFPEIEPQIQTLKSQFPALEKRHADLVSQMESEGAPSFFTDTSDPRHAAVRRTQEIMVDAKNNAKEKKAFLIEHAFHHLTFGPASHDKVQKILREVHENKTRMNTMQTQLETDTTLSHQDRNALTTKCSYVERSIAALLVTQIKDMQENPQKGGESQIKQLIDAQKK